MKQMGTLWLGVYAMDAMKCGCVRGVGRPLRDADGFSHIFGH
jgi:hypothetical protein